MKDDAQRAMSVPREVFYENHERIFGKKPEKKEESPVTAEVNSSTVNPVKLGQ